MKFRDSVHVLLLCFERMRRRKVKRKKREREGQMLVSSNMLQQESVGRTSKVCKKEGKKSPTIHNHSFSLKVRLDCSILSFCTPGTEQISGEESRGEGLSHSHSLLGIPARISHLIWTRVRKHEETRR